MRCPYCNTPITDNSVRCPHCGKSLGKTTAASRRVTGRSLGQPLQPVHIDESIDTIVFSNPVAERRNRTSSLFMPMVALAMALATVVLMGAMAQSSIAQLVHIGDASVKDEIQSDAAKDATSQEERGSEKVQSAASLPVNNDQTAAQTPPVFTAVEASTVLEGDSDEEHNRYKAENVLDRSMATAWNEGSPGDGVGEWIEVKADKPQHVKGVRICAGFASDDGTYYSNARPSAVKVTFDDQTSIDMELDDLFAQYQTLDLEQPKDTTSMRVTITAVYPGQAYSDCCIAEVQAY